MDFYTQRCYVPSALTRRIIGKVYIGLCISYPSHLWSTCIHVGDYEHYDRTGHAAIRRAHMAIKLVRCHGASPARPHHGATSWRRRNVWQNSGSEGSPTCRAATAPRGTPPGRRTRQGV
ncbi:uncharacterized protein PGTG_21340 [Puccinia graminis f. sp. tritici CRL 75-36-700-3]|uniref:Uncharacterized protein n=1 Tax=Puccinia graminis f. sp. tritici (strain CRL 75-36-700-3 / race SCCL) TaxID=418459 RepID=H6QQZ4_PUCGT|nr:uncharacterized protein PGTG_21340 [Puccinia graminis f. sp. tritici CRL 75-36-700-3]EHS62972.1 hypothetical protein PGTG_21340 [Puccinia graminis f. sp. tritici CRL 75-36-700-3]